MDDATISVFQWRFQKCLVTPGLRAPERLVVAAVVPDDDDGPVPLERQAKRTVDARLEDPRPTLHALRLETRIARVDKQTAEAIQDSRLLGRGLRPQPALKRRRRPPRVIAS